MDNINEHIYKMEPKLRENFTISHQNNKLRISMNEVISVY